MSDDLIYPLKWATIVNGVVTEHEREETYSSIWEKAFGKPYAPADRITELEAEVARLREALEQVGYKTYE